MRKYFSTVACFAVIIGLAVAWSLPVQAATTRNDTIKQVGDRSPTFSLATSQDNLADYDSGYYGRHHLVLTFFPAAFTPV